MAAVSKKGSTSMANPIVRPGRMLHGTYPPQPAIKEQPSIKPQQGNRMYGKDPVFSTLGQGASGIVGES